VAPLSPDAESQARAVDVGQSPIKTIVIPRQLFVAKPEQMKNGSIEVNVRFVSHRNRNKNEHCSKILA
jgi:hypothetical protein